MQRFYKYGFAALMAVTIAACASTSPAPMPEPTPASAPVAEAQTPPPRSKPVIAAPKAITPPAATPAPEPQARPSSPPPFAGQTVIIARDGTALPFSVWGSIDDPEAVVVALHSFGDYRVGFEALGKYLADRKVVTLAFDQRGFGQTADAGSWTDTQTMVNDVTDVVAAAKRAYGARVPVHLVGESMGGDVAILAAGGPAKSMVSSLIVSGPGVRENDTMRYLYNAGLWLVSSVDPDYVFENPMFYDGRLAPQHAERWAYDPLIVSKSKAQTYYDFLEMTDDASDKAGDVEVQTLVVYGTLDEHVLPLSICALTGRLNGYGVLHVMPDEPHLALQSADEDAIFSMIENWILNENTRRGMESGRHELCVTPLVGS